MIELLHDLIVTVAAAAMGGIGGLLVACWVVHRGRRAIAAHRRAQAQIELLRLALWLLARRVDEVEIGESQAELMIRFTRRAPAADEPACPRSADA